MAELTLPLMPTLLIGGSVITSLISVVVWAFATFERKERHEELEKRVSSLEQVMRHVAQDVSYIRGRLEPK